jgi:hypothetical protein
LRFVRLKKKKKEKLAKHLNSKVLEKNEHSPTVLSYNRFNGNTTNALICVSVKEEN